MDEQYMQMMMEQALTVLRNCVAKGESFMPVLFARSGNQPYVIGIPWKDNREKHELLRQAGQFLSEHDIEQCLIVTDSYVRATDKSKDMEYIKENWDTEQPSLYPEAMRKNALVMMGMDFKDSKNEALWMVEYTTKDNVVEVLNTTKGSDTGLAGGIKDTLLKGFIIGLCKGEITRDKVSAIIRDYPDLAKYLATQYRQ